MRNVLIRGMLLLVPIALCNLDREASAMDRGVLVTSPMSEVYRPVIEAKLKCGIREDGSFGCKKVDTKDHDKGSGGNKDKNQGSNSSGAAKCRGKNHCPAGYRDLDFPNKYGACCEQIPGSGSSSQEPDKPKTGGCRAVEKMSEMSCSPPFDAISCGPQQNGKMTCCCVK